MFKSPTAAYARGSSREAPFCRCVHRYRWLPSSHRPAVPE